MFIIRRYTHTFSSAFVNRDLWARQMSKMQNPIELSIRSKLSKNLNPIYMDVINESYMHNVPQGAETHFKVIVVSDQFSNISHIKKHRLVNEALKEELSNGVHALSIVAKTPKEWELSDKDVEPSPNCRGGFGK